MIKMEFAKFMFKYSNNMLTILSTIILSNLKIYTTTILDKKLEMSSLLSNFFRHQTGKKTLHHLGLNEWKGIPQEYRQCSFIKFKKFSKNKLLHSYD